MQALAQYLKALLFEYECVTIPGLGGFIMQSYPARINLGKNRISPPSRTPSFNILLNHDDGLLISSVSRAENISYYEAGLKISGYVEEIRNTLTEAGKIKLEGIGEFVFTPEKMILFRQDEQANFLPETFGLETISIYPAARQPYQTRLTSKPADRKALTADPRKPASVKWTLALSIPIIVFLLFGIIFPGSIRNIYTSTAGMADNILLKKVSAPVTTLPSVKEPVFISIPSNEKSAPEAIPEPQPEKETLIEGEKAIIGSQNSPKYYIIGGCFESEANASRFLLALLDKGFEAEQAGTNGRGHRRISYRSFPEKTSALAYLEKIKNEENPAAWLLKY